MSRGSKRSVQTELGEQQVDRSRVFRGRHCRDELAPVPAEARNKIGVGEVQRQPPFRVGLAQPVPRLVKTTVEKVPPGCGELCVERVVVRLIGDRPRFLDRPQRHTEVLGPVAERQQFGELDVHLVVAKAVTACQRLVTQRLQNTKQL